MVCSSGVGFDPVVDGEPLRFSAAGVYNGVFTMWDDRTGSVWSSLDGRALAGDLAGLALAPRALQTVTWEAWLAEHPETTVLDADTGFAYGETCAGLTILSNCRALRVTSLGREGFSSFFRDSLADLDTRLPEATLVIGVRAGDEARAFPVDAPRDDAPSQSIVGGAPIVILEDAAGAPSLAYHRALTDGRVLDFVRRDGRVVDVQTGSAWRSDGVATDGPLRGVRLTWVTSLLSEWYGWVAFNPGSTIHPDAP